MRQEQIVPFPVVYRYPYPLKPNTKIRFCISGGIATALHYLIMLLAMHAGIFPSTATALGALAGAIINYLLQYRFTFNSRRKHMSASTRYGAVAALGWMLNLAFFNLLHLGAAMPAYTAHVLIALCNYWISKRYVFP